MFEKVKLTTEDGRFVDHVIIPKFNPPAGVLILGARFFVFKEQRKGIKIYSETMAWLVLDQEQYKSLGL